MIRYISCIMFYILYDICFVLYIKCLDHISCQASFEWSASGPVLMGVRSSLVLMIKPVWNIKCFFQGAAKMEAIHVLSKSLSNSQKSLRILKRIPKRLLTDS